MADVIKIDKSKMETSINKYQDNVEILEQSLIELSTIKELRHLLKGSANDILFDTASEVVEKQISYVAKERLVYDKIRDFVNDMDTAETQAEGKFSI